MCESVCVSSGAKRLGLVGRLRILQEATLTERYTRRADLKLGFVKTLPLCGCRLLVNDDGSCYANPVRTCRLSAPPPTNSCNSCKSSKSNYILFVFVPSRVAFVAARPPKRPQKTEATLMAMTHGCLQSHAAGSPRGGAGEKTCTHEG